MKTEITHLLRGVKGVEVRKQNQVLVIIPLATQDPIRSPQLTMISIFTDNEAQFRGHKLSACLGFDK